jgi:hypothetical protein
MPLDLTTWIASASAIGTGASGIVEVLKSTDVGTTGLEHVVGAVGASGQRALAAFYGPDWKAVVQRAYRGSTSQLATQFKDALRVALRDEALAEAVSAELGQAKLEPSLWASVTALNAHAAGQSLTDDELVRHNARLATYTMAVDARVDAACAAATATYEVTMRRIAMEISLAVAVAGWLSVGPTDDGATLGEALLVGLLAVPLAPVARDLTSMLQNASDLFSHRRRQQPPS